MPTSDGDQLARHLAATLRDYLASERTRPDLIRAAAADVVELRSRFTTRDGYTDWSGRSSDYRALIASIYRDAGVPSEHMDLVRSAITYHAGNLLRERVPADELEAAGIRSRAPRERAQVTRERIREKLASIDPGMPADDKLGTALAVLNNIPDDAFAAHGAAEAAGVRLVLDDLEAELKRLRRGLPRRRG